MNTESYFSKWDKPNPISTLHMRASRAQSSGLEVEGYMLEHPVNISRTLPCQITLNSFSARGAFSLQASCWPGPCTHDFSLSRHTGKALIPPSAAEFRSASEYLGFPEPFVPWSFIALADSSTQHGTS